MNLASQLNQFLLDVNLCESKSSPIKRARRKQFLWAFDHFGEILWSTRKALAQWVPAAWLEWL